MTERERQVNHNLHSLDEAHRLGRITREEYRARRRYVLGTLCDSHGVTARNAIVPTSNPAPDVGGSKRVHYSASEEMLPTLFPSRPAMAWRQVLLFGGGAVLCALLLYGLLRVG